MVVRLEKVVAQDVSLLSRYVVEEGHCQRIARGFPVFPHNILTTPFILLYPNSLLWRVGFRVHLHVSGIVCSRPCACMANKFYYCSATASLFIVKQVFSKESERRNNDQLYYTRILFSMYNNCDNYFLFCV